MNQFCQCLLPNENVSIWESNSNKEAETKHWHCQNFLLPLHSLLKKKSKIPGKDAHHGNLCFLTKQQVWDPFPVLWVLEQCWQFLALCGWCLFWQHQLQLVPYAGGHSIHANEALEQLFQPSNILITPTGALWVSWCTQTLALNHSSPPSPAQLQLKVGALCSSSVSQEEHLLFQHQQIPGWRDGKLQKHLRECSLHTQLWNTPCQNQPRERSKWWRSSEEPAGVRILSVRSSQADTHITDTSQEH